MLFVITGPSGVGKSYLISRLLESYPDKFQSPPLTTTRTLRNSKPEIDRVSVSEDEFRRLQRSGKFAVVGEFQSNLYGFPAEIAQSQTKHFIINAWPALVPLFSNLPEVRFVCLMVADDNMGLLKDRMLARGDDEETVAKRMKQVKIDLADIKHHINLLEHRGKVFEVVDDDTIPAKVIPWLLGSIGLLR